MFHMAKATVYTTSTCPYCTMLTGYLEEQGIEYEEVNVQVNPEAGQRLVATTGQMGVPQTEINGKWIIGFDPNSVEQALRG